MEANQSSFLKALSICKKKKKRLGGGGGLGRDQHTVLLPACFLFLKYTQIELGSTATRLEQAKAFKPRN